MKEAHSRGVGGWRTDGDQAVSLGERQDSREDFEDAYPGAGEQAKNNDHYRAANPPSLTEHYSVRSTLHRLTQGSLTAFLRVVATVISSPISEEGNEQPRDAVA